MAEKPKKELDRKNNPSCAEVEDDGYQGVKAMVKEPSYICGGCNRVARVPSHLCAPEEL